MISNKLSPIVEQKKRSAPRQNLDIVAHSTNHHVYPQLIHLSDEDIANSHENLVIHIRKEKAVHANKKNK